MNAVHDTAAPSGRAKRREARAESFLDAAERVLAREGLDALTMQRVAAELDVTVGATYRYYASKDELLAALQRRVFATLADDLERALAAHDAAYPRASRIGALSRVCVVARIYTTLLARRPTHARLLAQMLGDPRPLLPAELGQSNVVVAMALGGCAVRELSAAREAGVLGAHGGTASDDVERALLLWTSLQGVAQASKLERWSVPGLDASRLAERMVATLLAGWGADPARVRDAWARASEVVPGELASDDRSAR